MQKNIVITSVRIILGIFIFRILKIKKNKRKDNFFKSSATNRFLYNG